MTDVQSVTLGRSPADLALRGGRVVSPTTRSTTRRDLAVVDGMIAGIFDDADPVIGPETRVIDTTGAVITPGPIDAHTHLDLHQSVETSYHRMLAGGATSIVSEVAGFGPAFGADGVRAFLNATAEVPVRVYATVPPQPVFDEFESPWADEAERASLRALLDRERVVGVGETAWPRIVGRETPAEMLYEAAHERGKVVTGHGAGCRGNRLQAFATWVDDDHEAISGDGVIERVDAGIHAVGRYGTIRDDIGAIVDAYPDLDPSEVSLSTDGMWPRELVRDGYMDSVLRRAVEVGIDPVDAIVMATITPARHFGLEGLGTLRPGTPADMTVFADLHSFEVETTIVGGDVVYDGGDPGNPAEPSYDYPDRFTDSVAVDVSPADLAIPVEAGTDGTVTAIEYGGGMLTGRDTVAPAVRNGQFEADPPDLGKVALFDRHPERDAGGFVGFLTGFGLESGAVATSLTWETAGVVSIGTNDRDMADAIGVVASQGGGWAVVEDGTVRATHPTPVGATCSRRPVEETAERYDAIETAIRELGVDAERPMLGLQTLSFFGVPALKLGFAGYVDIKTRETVGLAPE